MMMKKWIVWLGAAGGAALIGAQCIPVARTNPAVTGDLSAPPDVKAILRRACYDCHSHETSWPWYSHVAPFSWLVARDVRDARRAMNFSIWDSYSTAKRSVLLENAMEDVSERRMPLPQYMWLHPEARLGDVQMELLISWLESQRDAP